MYSNKHIYRVWGYYKKDKVIITYKSRIFPSETYAFIQEIITVTNRVHDYIKINNKVNIVNRSEKLNCKLFFWIMKF